MPIRIEKLWKLNLCTAENVRLYRDSLIGGEDSCPMGQDHDIAFPNPGNLQNRKIKGQNQMGLYFFHHFLHGVYLYDLVLVFSKISKKPNFKYVHMYLLMPGTRHRLLLTYVSFFKNFRNK